jgi:ATPase subunit of ABC transporter with duplicated ATPase domains
VQRGVEVDRGSVMLAENANVGYMPQDTYEEFPADRDVMDWMSQWTQAGDDETSLRGTLGRLLFSADDIKKNVKVLSGGEKGRMIWGKLMLGRHNVLGWTSRPTTWTWNRSSRCRSRSTSLPAR